jgi:hypothetical protein
VAYPGSYNKAIADLIFRSFEKKFLVIKFSKIQVESVESHLEKYL